MADGVKRIPVREGRIRGTLFLPPGEGPFPGRYSFIIHIQFVIAELVCPTGFLEASSH